ncbi:MAG: DNA primase [Pseudoflavonifractor sp.]|nr:DNA primase [Pseudoflavonifractor sp.]
MKKIDRQTVQRILDTADIVEVVSDFVHLKRRGSGYIGLCPFHNERTPSFSVSKTKNICKCFSCGKGGSPVNFIMEHEQLSYNEALRYLAKKYNIEIQEHEMSDEERRQESERESMLAINEFAMQHFEHNLTDTADGRDIGLAYFHERGINEAMIRRFHLGYSLDRRNDLHDAAIAKGYSEKYLVDTGLCSRNDRGQVYDRFKSRVMYPIFSVSGKVIAFGGRTLRSDKTVAKYVNSPESTIYSKSRELYGLYQAKQAIVRHDKCILVEGYMDVISMHQSGVENVVASSGTSLTEGQIRLIHRFTDNVTVIYDGDAAGIKASLRGIDMLLAEGLNVRVLLLPDGDDPDSFAQSHSATELEEYLATHETDFIRFKTDILLRGTANDPIQRAKVINDIVSSISVIPDEITRSVYIKECSRMLEIGEKVLAAQVARLFAEKAEKQRRDSEYRRATDDTLTPASNATNQSDTTARTPHTEENVIENKDDASRLLPYEMAVLRHVLKYGMLDFCEVAEADGSTRPMNVLDYVTMTLREDDISFSNDMVRHAFDEARRVSMADWPEAIARFRAEAETDRSRYIVGMEESLRSSDVDVATIQRKERELISIADQRRDEAIADFAASFIQRSLINHPDDHIRAITLDLVSEKYVLSKVHTKYAHIETERDRLADLVPRAVFELKDAILDCEIRQVRDRLRQTSDPSDIHTLMSRHIELARIKAEFARYLGDRIVAPRD